MSWAELFVTAAKSERVLGNHPVFYEKNSQNILLVGIMNINLLISQKGRELAYVVSSHRNPRLRVIR